jgi:DNA-binding LytR/AlgR family response regulator
MPDAPPLGGRRVLIVEDNYLLADDMRVDFERAGAEVVGPVARLADALQLVERGEPLDGAVLDINLEGEVVYRVADALRDRHIPFVFATGYDAEFIPAAYAKVVRLKKPVDTSKVSKALFGR